MNFKVTLLLIFTTFCFCQNKETKFYITKILKEDTLKHFTKYSVDYELKNSSNHDISFFNSTDNPLALNYRKTTVIYADYFVYDNKIKLNKELFISNKYFLQLEHFRILSEGKTDLEQKTYQDSIRKFLSSRIKTDTTNFRKKNDSLTKIRLKNISSHNDFDYIKNSIVTLKPNEIIKGTICFYWYKKKYRKIGDEEFYIDETPKEIELTMLITNPIEMKRYFDSKEFEKIKNNPNFIDGVFISNKMEINLKE